MSLDTIFDLDSNKEIAVKLITTLGIYAKGFSIYLQARIMGLTSKRSDRYNHGSNPVVFLYTARPNESVSLRQQLSII